MSGKSGFIGVAAELYTLLSRTDLWGYVICITGDMKTSSVH